MRLAVFPPRRGGLFGRLNDPRRTNQFQQHVLGIAAELMRDLSNEGLDRPGMRHVVDRAEPADPQVRLRLAAFQPDVRHVERRVDEAYAELDELRIFRIRQRKEARRRAAMTLGDDFVVLVEAGFEAFSRHGVIEAVADVVLAGLLRAN